MNWKKYLNISFGSIQAFLGLVLVILAFLIPQDFYNGLEGYRIISFLVLIVLGLLSIFSGFALSSK